jgi:hypothetical protein
VSEHGGVEVGRSDLALAASSFLPILQAHWIAETEYGNIARNRQSPTLPKKRNLARAVTGRVNSMQPAGDRQRFAIGNVPGGKGHRFLREVRPPRACRWWRRFPE